MLAPWAAAYGVAIAWRRRLYRLGVWRPQRLPVPVIVVGNLVVGGAGKTPTTLVILNLLRAGGWTPGVVSRGYGSARRDPRPVEPHAAPVDCGDEPLLIRRRAEVPVWVGADRAATGRALCAAHPEVDIVVSDDGLQHLALARDIEVIVFDARGTGNGRLLPAGPLREPFAPTPPKHALVVYNASQPTTPWPGHCVERRLTSVVSLRDWWEGAAGTAGVAESLAGQEVEAAAGIAEPERFFTMLESLGLVVRRWPLPDHADWHTVPWPPGHSPILVTEKDAVKLPPTHPD
ncbi:MAG: hypothetical protein RI988_3153, partial [Pseudomonadota bacterium]